MRKNGGARRNLGLFVFKICGRAVMNWLEKQLVAPLEIVACGRLSERLYTKFTDDGIVSIFAASKTVPILPGARRLKSGLICILTEFGSKMVMQFWQNALNLT